MQQCCNQVDPPPGGGEGDVYTPQNSIRASKLKPIKLPSLSYCEQPQRIFMLKRSVKHLFSFFL